MTRSQEKNDHKAEHAEKTPSDHRTGPTGFQPDGIEREVLRQWEAEKTFEESVKRRAKAPRYSFYDGPPYATGLPHYGHILQTALKDTVTRYWTMRGFLVDRRVGWDCHGLPVENMVEKELGIRTKREIEERGIDVFNEACRSAVLRHVHDWTTLLQRLGRWADYDAAYTTMATPFMESAWWAFKVAWDRSLVYRGVRSTPYCPRCETPLSNFETAQGYEEVTDPSVTVKVRLADEENVYLVVWTTTPWTLTANAAIAVHPDLRYVRARVGSETWIVAKDRAAEVIAQEHTIEDEFSGSVLVGRTYDPLYRFVEPMEPAFRVVAGTFVSSTDGTGLVHVAPAFGEEDFRLGQEEGLPLIQTVDTQGRFLPVVTPWAGKFVKEADTEIIEDLDAKGMIVRADTLRHAYPHCWRCRTPLLYMAVDSWFIAVSKMKEQLLKNAEGIHWVPEHLKKGRFGQGLKDAPDWAVSRSRYWGIPLPVWECQTCEQHTVVGSLQELTERGGDPSLLKSPHAEVDLHRPYVDAIVLTCAHCGEEARRVPEVLDVWFDSGSMPYGQWHYPFENKERVESSFPADFIGEALDQTRGWFYTLHVLAGILTQEDLGLGTHRPAFKNVVVSGLVLAEDGRKLSKSLKNYADPSETIAKYGADTLRLYLLTATSFGEDMRFSDRLVGELYKKFTLILWNVWQYYRTYAEDKKQGTGDENKHSLLDRWILARVAQLATDVRSAMEEYRVDDAARTLQPFVDDLSTWYVRRSRGRAEALPVLGEVLKQFSAVAAPFVPFLAEYIHRELVGASSHLADYPSSQLSSDEKEVLQDMKTARDWAAAVHRRRNETNHKLRQPLQSLASTGLPQRFEQMDWQQLMKEEANVKEVLFVSPEKLKELERSGNFAPLIEVRGGASTTISTGLTEDLKQEGIVRDLIRHIQGVRKNAGCRFDEQIVTHLDTDNADVRDAVGRFTSLLKEETKSTDIQFGRVSVTAEDTVEIGDTTVWVGITRQQ